MVVFISTSYFSVRESFNVKLLRKYWWKNTVIQILKYREITFIIATIGHGKANAAMIATYLMEKYKNISQVINIDLALSTNDKIETSNVTISTKFIYRDVDQTVFDEMKYGQIVDETETFQFDGKLAQKINNLNLNLLEAVIGTGDMQIYNTKQFKELIEKFGNSIDVIDEEAGALAQVFKKTEISFVSLKVIYNNALSPWDNDPKHRYKMYEITNTFKYLVRRILNFLASAYEYNILKLSDDTSDIVCSILETHHDNWVKRIKNDTTKIQGISSNSLMLMGKNEKDNWKVDFVKIKNSPLETKNNDIEAAKMILGVEEWRYAPSEWSNKINIIDEVHMNDEELLWNKSSYYKNSTVSEYKFTTLAKQFASIAKRYGENIQNGNENVNPDINIKKRALVLYSDVNLSFYISENSNHELIEDNKLGTAILKNEFIKLLNEAFEEQEMKYDKINIYISLIALYNKKIDLFIKSDSSLNKKISFGKVSNAMQKDYTVVDNMSEDKDINKVGSFKTSIKIKPL